MYTTLITAEELGALLETSSDVRIFDCSYDLMQPDAGYKQYAQQHIEGAAYADLNQDLSTHDESLKINGGRHPLPQREHFAKWLGNQGVSDQTQVVIYDRQNMSFCVRLWWMMRWCGHAAAAVLDGGLPAWLAANGKTQSGEGTQKLSAHFTLRAPLAKLVHTQQVAEKLGTQQLIIDARAAPRYRGEVEPLDPVAGHIPGALNRPFNNNLTSDGFMKPASQLREEFSTLLAQHSTQDVIHHCGSGVTATPNVLAMEVAGFGNTALYAGSWSEWCNTPGLPVERG
jgi:thiosulfate/3-mercaptopyruvate sulfurtransferase